MGIEEAKATIREAAHTGKPFWVRGYVDSKGRVSDRLLELLPHTAYDDLLVESVKMLKEAPPPVPAEVDPEIWNECVEEIIDSYEKRIHGDGVEREETNPPVSEKEPLDVIRVKPGETNGFHVEHLRLCVEQFLEEVPPHNYRNEYTQAKALVRESVPLAKYVGRISLREGKFESVELTS